MNPRSKSPWITPGRLGRGGCPREWSTARVSFGPRGEIGLKAQKLVACANEPVEPGLGQTQFIEELRRLVAVELADLLLDLGRDPRPKPRPSRAAIAATASEWALPVLRLRLIDVADIEHGVSRSEAATRARPSRPPPATSTGAQPGAPRRAPRRRPSAAAPALAPPCRHPRTLRTMFCNRRSIDSRSASISSVLDRLRVGDRVDPALDMG